MLRNEVSGVLENFVFYHNHGVPISDYLHRCYTFKKEIILLTVIALPVERHIHR